MAMTVKSFLSDIQKSLGTLATQTAKLREALETTRTQLDTLKAERQKLRATPVTREDWLEMCLTHVDRKADEYGKSFGSAVIGYAHHRDCRDRPECCLDKADFVLGNDGTIPLLPVFGNEVVLHGDPPFDRDFAYFLFREPLKTALRQAFAETPDTWPYRNAAPYAELARRLEALNADIAELEATEREIMEQAKAMGVELPAR